jgi:uncharacterized membrane protein YidH (DUF202 family)
MNQLIITYYHHHRGGGEYTIEQAKFVIGVLIVLLAIWACTSAYSVYKYFKQDRSSRWHNSFTDIYFYEHPYNFLMTGLSVVFGICVLGYYVSTFL